MSWKPEHLPRLERIAEDIRGILQDLVEEVVEGRAEESPPGFDLLSDAIHSLATARLEAEASVLCNQATPAAPEVVH